MNKDSRYTGRLNLSADDVNYPLGRDFEVNNNDDLARAWDAQSRATYEQLRQIGVYIAGMAQQSADQGGDHDYDGVLQHVWQGIHDALGIDGSKCMLIPLDGDCTAEPRKPRTTKHGYVRRSFSSPLRLRIYKRDGYRCVFCGSNEDLSIDHRHPVSRGGTNDEDNLQTLCMPCNVRKGAKVEAAE